MCSVRLPLPGNAQRPGYVYIPWHRRHRSDNLCDLCGSSRTPVSLKVLYRYPREDSVKVRLPDSYVPTCSVRPLSSRNGHLQKLSCQLQNPASTDLLCALCISTHTLQKLLYRYPTHREMFCATCVQNPTSAEGWCGVCSSIGTLQKLLCHVKYRTRDTRTLQNLLLGYSV